MTEARGFRSEREVDRERFGQFLRTVVKLFLLVFVVAALLSPPEPLAFTLALVPGWLVAFPVAYYLVYRDGYDAVRASDAYRPGPLAGRTTVSFAAIALGLKVGLSLFYDAVVPLAHTRAESLFISLVALVAGYLLVYQGVLGWFSGDVSTER